MKRVLYSTIIIFFFTSLGVTLFFNSSLIFASEVNATMTVEVDLIGFNSTASEISIEIPDYVDLGKVSKTNPISSEEGIWINNTGTVDIRITPELNDPDEKIFNYLYFRKQLSTTSNNTDLITFKKIGDYHLDINKPRPGKNYEDEHCYMQLNLTEFDGIIKEDVDNYQADIVFFAVPK